MAELGFPYPPERQGLLETDDPSAARRGGLE